MNQGIFRILVVDDEDATRITLADILRLEGYQVDTASGGEVALQMVALHAFDLILLDLKMPGVDGLEVLRHITRPDHALGATTTIPTPPTVIMLTAHGSLESAIEALLHGAQDYLLKPSSPEQILKSVSQGLRTRTALMQKNARLIQLESAEQQAAESSTAGVYQTGLQKYRLPHNISIDLARREIVYHGQIIKLTPTEGKLMKVLLENPSRVFSHRELVLLVQGYDTKEWEAPEILRPLVSRLRRKLINLPGGDRWITSVRGTGYIFEVNQQTRFSIS